MVPVRRRAGHWGAYVAAGIALALLAGRATALDHSPAQQHPAQASENHTNTGTDQRSTTPFASPIAVSVSGDLKIETHGDAGQSGNQQPSPAKSFFSFSLTDSLLTAFTAVLAVVGIWQGINLQTSVGVAKEAADAALLQAKILAATEAPIIGIQQVDIVVPSGGADRVVVPGVPPAHGFVAVSIGNAGRTSATIKYFATQTFVGAEPPAELPEFTYVTDPNHIILA